MLEILGIIVLIILIIVYVVFFVGMGKVFSDKAYSANNTLQNYFIAFTVILVVNIIFTFASPMFYWFHSLLFIVNLVLIYLIYFSFPVNSQFANSYILPALVVLTLVMVLVIIAGFYFTVHPKSLKDRESTLAKYGFKNVNADL